MYGRNPYQGVGALGALLATTPFSGVGAAPVPSPAALSPAAYGGAGLHGALLAALNGMQGAIAMSPAAYGGNGFQGQMTVNPNDPISQLFCEKYGRYPQAQEIGGFLAELRMVTLDNSRMITPQNRPHNADLHVPVFKAEIAASATVDIDVIPKCVEFEASEFTVSNRCAGNFRIMQLQAGMLPMFGASGGIDALCYTPDSLTSRTVVGRVRGGQPLTVTVQNITRGVQDFSGHFSGGAKY